MTTRDKQGKRDRPVTPLDPLMTAEELIQALMDDFPELTREEAIAALETAGGL